MKNPAGRYKAGGWLAIAAILQMVSLPCTRAQGRDTPVQRGGIVEGFVQTPSALEPLPPGTRATLRSIGPMAWERSVEVEPGGHFLFEGVPRGDHTLYISAPGFQPLLQALHHVDYTRVNLQLVSHSGGFTGPVPSGSRATVSVAELMIPPAARKEMLKAEQESKRGEHRRSIAHLKKALKLCRDCFQAYNNLAVQYLKTGQTDKARQAALRSLALKPEEPLSLRNLGLVYMADGKFVLAQKIFQRARSLQPQDPATLFYLAETHYQLKDYRGALDLLRQAEGLGRQDGTTLLRMGQCAFRLHRYEEALKLFQRLLQSHPRDPRSGMVNDWVVKLEKSLAAAGRP